MLWRPGRAFPMVLKVFKPIITTPASLVFWTKNCLSSLLVQEAKWLEFLAMNPSAVIAAIRKAFIYLYRHLGLNRWMTLIVSQFYIVHCKFIDILQFGV